MNSESIFESPEGWLTESLGQLCERGGGYVQTGPFGSQLHAEDYTNEGVPVVMPQDLVDGRVQTREIARIAERDVERLARHRLRPGDIVYSRRGDISRKAVISEREAGWLCGTGCLKITPGRAVDERYLAYYLSHPRVQNWLERHAVGATMPNLNTKILSDVPVTYPPRDEQRRIASVLGSLDDKIELNRRIAKTLEQIAATIFKARFVDFVGVEEFEESELGLIPKGWSVCELADLAHERTEIVKGDDDRPYIGLDAMPRASTVLDEWRTEGAPRGQARLFQQNDILFGKLRPYFKKVGPAPIDGRCSTEILAFRTEDEDWGFVLGHLASQAFIDHAVRVSSGTRMPRAEWKVAGKYRVAVPPREDRREFSEIARTCYERIHASTRESQALVAIRDSLLPKLISGQLRVPEGFGPDEAAEVADGLVESEGQELAAKTATSAA